MKKTLILTDNQNPLSDMDLNKKIKDFVENTTETSLQISNTSLATLAYRAFVKSNGNEGFLYVIKDERSTPFFEGEAKVNADIMYELEDGELLLLDNLIDDYLDEILSLKI